MVSKKVIQSRIYRQKNQHYTKRTLILRIYRNQKIKSKMRGHNPPEYTRDELIDWVMNQDVYHKLFDNYINSGYNIKKIPSIDRLNDDIGYSFGNIQIVTWEENDLKGKMLNKNLGNLKTKRRVIVYQKNNVFCFSSVNKCSNFFGVNSSTISKFCRGKKGGGNLIFQYA